MDFKKLMSAQIAKGKPGHTPNPSTTNGTSKYQRKADAEKEREAAYIAEQARLEKERHERLVKKRKFEEDEAERSAVREEKRRRLAEESRVRREKEEAEEERQRRKRLGLPELAPEDGEVGERPDIEDDELRRKLMELKELESTGEDETHEERLARYYKLTAVSKALSKRRKWYPGPIPTTIEPLPSDEIILPTTVAGPDEREAYIKLHRQISSYINFLLEEWSVALAGRSKDDAQSSAGIQATNNYKIALQDLTPLMRRLEAAVYNPYPPPSTTPNTSTSTTTKQTRPSNPPHDPLPHTPLLLPLVDILSLTQRRHYRDATDAYLRLSIGKAAWPIGVTMVGIHERSAREKLHEDGKGRDSTAHIMSDEGTRKWLQSLKRCVSFAQSRFAPWDVGQLMG